MLTFENLGLIRPLCLAVKDTGYSTPTPIQQSAIGPILEGKDILGNAQTGTGKTAAFALPILQRLSCVSRNDNNVRALVLVPTRELALQVKDNFRSYGKNLRLRINAVYGGVGIHQQRLELQRGVDILVATPGRLLDLVKRKWINLRHVEILVLDEADRMLDMGFIHDIQSILSLLQPNRQNLLFSATMPQDVLRLVNSILHNPVKIKVAPISSTHESIDQCVYFVDRADKRKLLLHILKSQNVPRGLVFTRTKHNASNVSEFLNKSQIRSEAIHGNKSQSARQKALESFRSGRVQVLVASDIASRGIDIADISHVINFDIPEVPETYVHRIGRTGRAAANGIAISLCDRSEFNWLRDIEQLTRNKIKVFSEHPFPISQRADVQDNKPQEVKQSLGRSPSKNMRKNFRRRQKRRQLKNLEAKI